MCGISAILGAFSFVAEQESAIEKMASALQHRGPDGWGTYLAPRVALAHNRLSIIDLSDGYQPLSTERTIISYNGEVYNYVELRQDLRARGAQFKTRCDTEVVQRLYELEGPAGLSKLNGQFAFLIWDRPSSTLTAVRDRYGVRPLYVLEWNQRVYFSSEMKAFDSISDYQRAYDPAMLLEHAALWNTLGSSTVYRNIRSVEAGTYESYCIGESPRKGRYYELGCTTRDAIPLTTFADAVEQFTALLQDSVDLRLRSDVPVGAYLSGGIDSSIIACLAKKRKLDDFETFSVSFEDEIFDESAFQKEVSESIESKHVDVHINVHDIEETFFDAIYHTERPIFRTAPIPLYLLSKRVRESDIRVVLTGEGADEILYGYDSFKELMILALWKESNDLDQISKLLKQLYPHINHYSDPTRFGMIRLYYEEFLNDFDNELGALNIRAHNNLIVQKYLNKDWGVTLDKEGLLSRLRQSLPAEFREWSLLQRQTYLEIRTLMQGYLMSSQGDRMALGHGIEGRFPFLDHRVVDAVFQYPDAYKLNGLSQKHILREAFRGKIPNSVVDRPKKPYMAPDLISFFREGQPTERTAHFLSEQTIREYGIFDPTFVNRFLFKFTRRKPNEIGYRDNMIITFLLSAQMAAYWARHPRLTPLDKRLQRVRIDEN